MQYKSDGDNLFVKCGDFWTTMKHQDVVNLAMQKLLEDDAQIKGAANRFDSLKSLRMTIPKLTDDGLKHLARFANDLLHPNMGHQ